MGRFIVDAALVTKDKWLWYFNKKSLRRSVIAFRVGRARTTSACGLAPPMQFWGKKPHGPAGAAAVIMAGHGAGYPAFLWRLKPLAPFRLSFLSSLVPRHSPPRKHEQVFINFPLPKFPHILLS